MLQPKRTKFRKMHKGRIRGEAKGGSSLNFGTYGLKATEPERGDRASDRSRASCDDPSHETSGSRLDPDFSGPASHIQTCRGADG